MLLKYLQLELRFMIRFINFRVLAAALLACCLQFASAQAPSGNISFSFDTATIPVWDLSGAYQIEQDMIGTEGTLTHVSYSIYIVQDSTGRLRNSDTTTIYVGDNAMAVKYTVSGTVTRSKDVAKANFSVNLSGNDTFNGFNRRVHLGAHYTLQVDEQSLSLTGNGRGSVNLGGLGSGRLNSDVTIPLPSGATGAWNVQMNILALNRLGGSGSVTTFNGDPNSTPDVTAFVRSMPTSLSGSFSDSTGIAKVRLSGSGTTARGTTLNLQFTSDADGNQIVSLSGRVLGQTIKY
jgi:hypothetical protein